MCVVVDFKYKITIQTWASTQMNLHSFYLSTVKLTNEFLYISAKNRFKANNLRYVMSEYLNYTEWPEISMHASTAM